jgi:subtilisin family serine protease
MRSYGLPLRHCWRLAGALALGLNATIALAEGPPPANPAQSFSPPSSAEPATSAVSPSPRKHAAHSKVQAAAPVARPRAARIVQPSPPAAIRVFPPPPGETRFRRDEILVELPTNVSQQNVALILRRHRLTESEAVPIALLGTSLHLWRIADARSPGDVLRELGGEPLIASAQPNYVFALQEDASAPAATTAAPQYALAKLRVDVTRDLVTGDKVLVAVIDTAIDETHPDLSGIVEARFDAIGGQTSTRGHGTSIAGAIAAHGGLQGVAPRARILAARAFETVDAAPHGTTLSILKAIDWAVQAHARVINMSFAGPQDPAMHRILGAAFDRNVMLIASAGNAGHLSAPLFPAADEKVLAVTATDSEDKLFDNANIGRYVAVAAPGVDVLLPAPGGAYGLETGTSVSAALASGVAALILEHHPELQPAALRKLLTATAKPLGAGGHESDFGAGLVDALHALTQSDQAAPTQ